MTRSLGGGQELHPLDESDADELYRVIDANRAYLSEWLPWPPAQTLEITIEFIRRSQKQAADNQGFQVLIVDHRLIVGTIGFHRIDWPNRSTSLGYWIAERAQGRGTVTRAVRALTEHAFSAWRLNRLAIEAGVGNSRSRAVPARLGFVEEGVLRQVERIGNRWVDHVVYSMLAADWPAGGGAPPVRESG